jgi:TRAP-type mannitol/chloroaromatic compound transport system permease small subunit
VQPAIRLVTGLEALVDRIGRLAAWLIVPLILVTVFDVVSRRYFVLGSTALQEIEWHLHSGLFLLCLGYGYVRNAHVRIEILRERMTSSARAWVEVMGCLFFLVPYCLVTLYYGVDFVHSAWSVGERSSSPGGLCCRWAIKATLPLGLLLMLLAGIAVLLRHVLILRAPAAVERELPLREEWR